MINDPDCPKNGKHRDLEAAQIKKSEKAVQRVLTAISHFTNPFRTPNKDRLYSLASGAPMPEDIERDILRADRVGKALKADFISNRLGYASSACFFDPLPKQNLKNMECNNKKVTLKTSEGKLIQYQEQSNLAFRLLVKSQTLNEPIDLNILCGYSLVPTTTVFATPDGFFTKTNKAAMMHFLMEEESHTDQYPKNSLLIQDGNALFHTMTDLAPTFGGIALQLLDVMVPKRDFVFSTDSYHPGSIKTQERLRRGSGEQFLLDGSSTRKPKDFKSFLTNDENKKQFCKMLLDVWSSSHATTQVQKCNTAVLAVDGKAHTLSAENNQVRLIQ